MDRIARLLAIAGGIVLVALIAITCLSIAGRSLNTILHTPFLQSAVPGIANWLLALGIGPINGDFELMEAGMAFAIFAFLPICQLHGSHASVDIFTALLPLRTNRVLRAVIEVVFAAVIVLIAWQLIQGTISKQASGQTTLLLQFPVWWAYAVSVIGAVTTAVVSIYVAALRVLEVVFSRAILPPEMEADH